jgi:phosphatidylinositol alpha-1,6-mannosyltransferase
VILVLTQCYPPDQGGIETLMGGLVAALRASGKSVHVLADRIRSKAAVRDGETEGTERFGGLRPIRRWLKRRRAGAILRQGSVEAVIADSWKSLEALPDLSRMGITIPVLALAHGMEFPARLSVTKSRRIKQAFAKASTIIAVSHFSAGLARAFLGPVPLLVIHPPLPDMPEADAMARAEVAKLLGEAPHGPRLLSLSRLEPRKGIDQVIRSLPSLVQDNPDLLYIIGGGGADRSRLEALAQDLGVAQYVRFLGFVPEVLKPALYEAADVFVMPVRREGDSVEGFGIVYMEAAYYGTPSLAGAEGGAVDAVLDEQTGLVVDGRDGPAITAQLRRLLGDAALRQRLGTAARERARTEFSWAHAVKTFCALCEKTG